MRFIIMENFYLKQKMSSICLKVKRVYITFFLAILLVNTGFFCQNVSGNALLPVINSECKRKAVFYIEDMKKWEYKIVNGKVYRRLYNVTTGKYETDWMPV